MSDSLIRLDEPKLLFRYGQAMEDPRDGLTLFGPLDEGKPYGIRAAVVGTSEGIQRLSRWVSHIQMPIYSDGPVAHPMFPGFQAAFQIPWDVQPVHEIEVPTHEINEAVHLDDSHQRVYNTVDIYSRRIIDALTKEDFKADLWFVIIPEEIYQYCRPKSQVEREQRIKAVARLPVKQAKRLLEQPALFEEMNIAAIPYHYELNFHNQLKARLLNHDAPTQVIRESTIAYEDFLNKYGRPKRDLRKLESAIAWNISTTVFYKAGGRPWKIDGIRERVCYIGLVFKKDENSSDPKWACCAAQMFLDSGDGVVFRGNHGPWYTPDTHEYHLDQVAARELVALAISSYKQKHNHQPPKELFIHGRVRFDDNEWIGFNSAVDSETSVIGVRIRETNDIKLFKQDTHPVLRGLAYIRDARTAYLWTKGYTPRLQTYVGREVPNPLLVDVCRGTMDIDVVLQDLMALTKLNYNSCIFADGQPVTLRFADAVGEILTAGPTPENRPLQFKYYI